MKTLKHENIKTINKNFRLCFYVLVFLCSCVLAHSVAAMTVISPAVDLTADPGQTVSGVVKLFNETNQDIALVFSMQEFKAGDQNGQPVFLPEEKSNFLQWFTVSEKTVNIPARNVYIIPFSVAVPKNATPGGYYAAIFWQSSLGPADQSKININSRVGTLVFLKVNGQLEEKGQIKEFSLLPDARLFWQGPVGFSVKFANEGNIHLAPGGTIEITGWLGQKKTLWVNADNKKVLPGSLRRFDIVWQNNSAKGFWPSYWSALKTEIDNFAFGPQKAALNLTFGSDNAQKASAQLFFWFFPLHLIITVIGALIVLIILIKFNSKIKRLKRPSQPSDAEQKIP